MKHHAVDHKVNSLTAEEIKHNSRSLLVTNFSLFINLINFTAMPIGYRCDNKKTLLSWGDILVFIA
jgi:hypothetical protein